MQDKRRSSGKKSCDEIIGFMRNFFFGIFKDNKNLLYGFLTGILRIAQESIFNGTRKNLQFVIKIQQRIRNCFLLNHKSDVKIFSKISEKVKISAYFTQ